jgi:hypothetical protein
MSTPEDQLDADNAPTQGVLSALQQPTQSPEGRAWGDAYLKAHPQGIDTSGEDSLLNDFAASAEDARTTLRQAREKLAAQRMDPSVLGLRVAQSLLSPSKGGVPDQFSKAFGDVADWRQQNQAFQQQQGAGDLNLAQQLNDTDKQQLQARLALQKLREQTGSQLLGTALKATAAPQGHFSLVEKAAALPDGSPGKQSYVVDSSTGNITPYGKPAPVPKTSATAIGPIPPELQKAVDEGRLDPTRINSRTAPILSQLAVGNPTLDFNRMHSDAALQANSAFQQKALTLETIPDILKQVTDAGKKVGYSDERTVGKMQAWAKGEFNDPDYTAYMTKRNDALMNIASVMRGQGMSDQAHKAEVEAAAPTLSPKALDAWFNAQYELLQPRLARTQQITHHTTPTTPSSGEPPVSAAAPVQISTDDEYNKLPSGALFISPDGHTRKKP